MKYLEKCFALKVRDLPRDAVYLAGISGGRDSVVLLRLLLQERFANLIVCHLNHGVRKEAQRDLEFSNHLAELSHLRFISDILPVGSAVSEGALRSSRMEFFARTTAQAGASGVFLGHHADDLSETFLWNLLRGSGGNGLGGIQAESQLVTKAGPLRILRPMLDIWRAEIDGYVRDHSLQFVDDETNHSDQFTRNRLRREIIPWLEEKLGRNIRKNLHQTAAILRDESDYLDALADLPDGGSPLPVGWLKEKPVALQRRIIFKWLQHHQIVDISFQEVESVRALLDLKTGPARANLPQNQQARRRSGKIFLSLQSD